MIKLTDSVKINLQPLERVLSHSSADQPTSCNFSHTWTVVNNQWFPDVILDCD